MQQLLETQCPMRCGFRPLKCEWLCVVQVPSALSLAPAHASTLRAFARPSSPDVLMPPSPPLRR